VELKDNAHGISEERLLRRFKRIFEHNKEIDDAEIRRFVNFVYTKMAKHDKEGIDVQDFSSACTHGEALHFKTLVELFDADRKKGFLERTFAGPTMRRLFKSDGTVHDDHNANKADDFIDLSKGRASKVFEEGYVADPVQAVSAMSVPSGPGNTGNDSVHGQVKIFQEFEKVHLQGLAQDVAPDGTLQYRYATEPAACDLENGCGPAALFPFCSSHVKDPLFHSSFEVVTRSPAYIMRQPNDEMLTLNFEQSILAPCMSVDEHVACGYKPVWHPSEGKLDHEALQITQVQTRDEGIESSSSTEASSHKGPGNTSFV
jgi:hypothetical protein